jgi:hypothetical protein
VKSRETASRITDGLERDGARLPAGFVPTAVSDSDVAGAVRVITFDVTLPTKESSRVERWDALPAFSDGYEPASRAILTKIEVLIRELEKTTKRKG